MKFAMKMLSKIAPYLQLVTPYTRPTLWNIQFS